MSSAVDEMLELHWLFDMIQTIDVGLVVLNTDFEVELWNGFMENHSGITSSSAKGKPLFSMFEDIPADWLKNKLNNVKSLRTPFYISWEQMPHLFPFTSYRPITSLADKMYQNVTLRPISHVDGSIKHLCMVIYDVSDIATSKVSLSSVNVKLDYVKRNDMVTGLKNRSSLEAVMAQHFALFQADQKTNNSLILMEIDDLRQFHLTHGYRVGDEVFEKVAELLGESVRAGDYVSRFTSGMFAILLPNVTQDKTEQYCQGLAKRVASTKFATSQSDIKLTMSFGVAQATADDKTVEDWLGRADKALFNAQTKGGNCAEGAV